MLTTRTRRASLVAENGQFKEDCWTLRAKSEHKNTWTSFQANFIEAHAGLWECQQTSRQGVYHTGTKNNAMELYVEFANMEHATAEDHSAVTNLSTANSTLT